jgi:general secretion pathway protein L
MLREFFRWWLAEVADCFPERWRNGAGETDAVVVTPAAPLSEPVDSIVVTERRKGRETMIGRFSVGGGGLTELRPIGKPAVLRLAEHDVLNKTLMLPIAAERQLNQVLTFEMDRETPFSPEELFWNYRVIRRDRSVGQVWVRVQLIQRAKLTRLLDALDRAGLKPQRAEFTEASGAKSYVPLDIDDGQAPRAMRPSLLWAALACCLVLALAAAAIPFIRQELDLAALDRKIAADRVAASEAQDLRKQIEQFAASADLVESERAKGGRPLAILAALTRMLPEDTYLTELVEQQRKVTISGRSAAASRLISILAAGEQLRNPTFTAPVTRIEPNHSEVFTITAEIAP